MNDGLKKKRLKNQFLSFERDISLVIYTRNTGTRVPIFIHVCSREKNPFSYYFGIFRINKKLNKRIIRAVTNVCKDRDKNVVRSFGYVPEDYPVTSPFRRFSTTRHVPRSAGRRHRPTPP